MEVVKTYPEKLTFRHHTILHPKNQAKGTLIQSLATQDDLCPQKIFNFNITFHLQNTFHPPPYNLLYQRLQERQRLLDARPNHEPAGALAKKKTKKPILTAAC